MSQDPTLRELLSPMIEQQVDLDGLGFRVDRQRVLSRMAQAAQIKEPARRSWVAYAALAAAGVLVLVTGARLIQHRDAGASASLEVLVSEGSATRIDGTTRADVAGKQNVRIAASGQLDTGADSKARVRTTDGLELELQSQTSVALGELQPSASQLKLLGGSVRCTIPHRTAAHAFQVVTPDITVVDLGTVFMVSIDSAAHATRVSVEEGEVMVRRGGEQIKVQAPSSWSSNAPVAVDSSAAGSAPELPSSLPDVPPASSVKGLRHLVPPTATLAQEAQLLRQGLAAERQGRSSEAISSLTRLLEKYPHSPLVPDARAALARVEAGTQR